MKFVYFDYGGSHSSVLAANIHAGNLSKTKTPSLQELMEIPLFDKTIKEDFGKMQYIGVDELGNEIYLIGTKNSNFGSTIHDLAELLEVSSKYIFIGTMPYVNLILRIGGFLSRGLSKPSLGRPLVYKGAKAAYPGLVSLVERTKLQFI